MMIIDIAITIIIMVLTTIGLIIHHSSFAQPYSASPSMTILPSVTRPSFLSASTPPIRISNYRFCTFGVCCSHHPTLSFPFFYFSHPMLPAQHTIHCRNFFQSLYISFFVTSLSRAGGYAKWAASLHLLGNDSLESFHFSLVCGLVVYFR